MFGQEEITQGMQPQVLGAVVAASGAFLASLFTLLSQHKTRKQLDRHRTEDKRAEVRRASVDHYRRQLDDLYGEMLILRKTSRRLWDRLRADLGEDEFRLIDQIEAIHEEATAGSDKRARIVDQILAINARLAKLIESRASLLTELPPPETFLQFLDHQRALADLWDRKQNADGSEPSFPRHLDRDIDAAISEIQTKLNTATSTMLGVEPPP